MSMNNYLWDVSVFVDDCISPIQTLEVSGSSTDIRTFAKKQCYGDRFEAVPKPLECFGIQDCQYDHLFFATMKIRGELPQALVD